MATQTYVALATTTLASATGSITFSSIPATYRDLVLVVSFQTSTDTSLFVRFNSDSGSNYSLVRMWGTGSSTASDSQTQTYADMEAGTTSGQINTSILQIMDYSATDKHKTILYRSNQNLVAAGAQRWANTSAINNISIDTSIGTFNVGTTFSLFGIEA